MKKYQFKTYEDPLQDFLETQSNISEFIRNILDDYRTGKLMHSENASIKEQLEQEKLIEKQNKNSVHETQKRKLEAETKIVEYHADNLDVVGGTPSSQAKKAMAHYTHKKLNGFNEYVQRKYKIEYFQNDTKPYKALCQICEALFEGTDRQEVTDDVCWHIEEIHKQRAEIVVSKN